ncbi:MAG TPA: zinc ribbon domain-containing protein [Acidimicrobiales bacterium]|nr:zinc ribbon domain-containing protein [Acidimicrobiales bacterium]
MVQVALDVLLVVAVGGMLWSAVARIRQGRVVVPRCPSCGRAVSRANPRCPHCDALLS